VHVELLEERQRRILTSHTGSLPRPDALSALLFARMSGQSYEAAWRWARSIWRTVAKATGSGSSGRDSRHTRPES
jgi:hypothetical protein